MHLIIKIVSTFFYVGYLPFIPGTFASAVGVLLFYLLKGKILTHTLSVFILIIAGFLVSGKAEKIFGKKDARFIVIDEVSGMLLSFSFLPYDIKIVMTGFILFRILDTFKPYPADRLQGLPGSAGVMSDDLVAGLYTNIILQAVLRLLSWRIS